MQHKVVSREEWLAARKAHLKNEKALTRMRDLVSAERRALPWTKVENTRTLQNPSPAADPKSRPARPKRRRVNAWEKTA